MTLSQSELDWRYAEVQLTRVKLGTATEQQIEWLIGYLSRKKDELGGPRPVPSGHPGIVKITKEQYESIKKIVIEASANKPTTATHIQALDAVAQMSYCFGASSRDYITLYPTIG